MMRIAYNIQEMKIGCPLLQAAMDGDLRAPGMFDPKHWQIAPSDALKVYEITQTQFDLLLQKMEKLDSKTRKKP